MKGKKEDMDQSTFLIHLLQAESMHFTHPKGNAE